jgi:hypothetical protein
MKFAHSNAKATAGMYVQTVVAYEINSEVFQLEKSE